MKIPVFFAVFLAIFHYGHALDCFKCNGCETAKILKETCRNVDPETKDVSCLTQKLRTGGTADSMTIKKCIVYDKNGRFECPILPSGETIGCNLCHTDLCNSGTKAKGSFYVYSSVFALLVLPFIYN